MIVQDQARHQVMKISSSQVNTLNMLHDDLLHKLKFKYFVFIFLGWCAQFLHEINLGFFTGKTTCKSKI
jgi:hypothetical protein